MLLGKRKKEGRIVPDSVCLGKVILHEESSSKRNDVLRGFIEDALHLSQI